MTPEQKLAEVKSAVSKLSEYFDSVQILATGLDEQGNTQSFRWGSGNMFSRIGLADDFVEYERGRIHAQANKDVNA